MTAKLLTVLLFLSCFLLSGASAEVVKKTEIPFYPTGRDTSLWYKWKSGIAREANLPDLIYNTDSFHFRFWNHSCAVDIWTNNFKDFYGSVTGYAQKYNSKLYEKGERKIEKVISNRISLDNETAKEIYTLIADLKLTLIPADEKIKGWNQGFDGYEYCIELATKDYYAFRTYWSPDAFTKTLNEAERVQSFADSLVQQFHIFDLYHLDLPAGYYQHEGFSCISVQIAIDPHDNGIDLRRKTGLYERCSSAIVPLLY